MSLGREGQNLFFNSNGIGRLPGQMLTTVNGNGYARNTPRTGEINHRIGDVTRPRSAAER